VRNGHEGTPHPDCNAQFEHINSKADSFLQSAQPVIFVDTKKKGLRGDFKRAGQEWQPKKRSEKSVNHDVPRDPAGKAIPYGIYDMSRYEAWVSVGIDYDILAVAVASLRRCWGELSTSRYLNAREMFIIAAAVGGNGLGSRTWKQGLHDFANEAGMRVHFSHFPTGTCKWNKIEHRLLCCITQHWRRKPLQIFETVVDLIGNPRTDAGLRVKTELDMRKHPNRLAETDAEIKAQPVRRGETRDG